MGFELVAEKNNSESNMSSFAADLFNPGEGLSGSPLLQDAERISLDGTGMAAALCAGAALRMMRANPESSPSEVVSEMKKNTVVNEHGFVDCSSLVAADAASKGGSSDSQVGGPRSDVDQASPRSLKSYREMIERQERDLGEQFVSPWKKVRRHEESLHSLGFPKENPRKMYPFLPRE